MKKIILSFFALSFSFIASAQSVTKADAFGFEPMGNKVGAYWWTPKDRVNNLTASTEKAASGKYSLKYDCKDFGTWVDVRTQSSANDAPIALEEGTYVISAQVYLTKKSPSQFRLSVADDNGATTTGFKTVIFEDLNDLPKGQWVEVKLTTKLPTFTKAKMVILFEKKANAVGTMYIDDIKITKAQ